MIAATRLPTLLRITAFALTLVALPGTATASDCARATSPVDKAICTSPDLQALDARLNKLYASLIQDASGSIHKDLVAQERSWLQQRNAQCAASPTAACLSPLYQSRIRTLAALHAAADTDPDGDLKTLTPLILEGSWRAGPVTPSGADALKQIAHQNLPAPGQIVTATAESLCFPNNDCREISWTAEKISDEFATNRLADELHLKAGQPMLVGRFEGKYSLPVMLIRGTSGAMDAIFAICTNDARGECQNHLQHWSVVKP